MSAVVWPESGIGWIAVGVIIIVVVLVLGYLHVRDENVRSIRFGVFLERIRQTRPDDAWPDRSAELPSSLRDDDEESRGGRKPS